MTAPPTTLLIEVFLHEGRYHGEAEWPPSPARLFQALVAGGARGSSLGAEAQEALRCLEELPPPIIGSPRAYRGQDVKIYVPNNDLDAKGGDPNAVATIRTGKWFRPRLFDASVPFLYVWSLKEETRAHTAGIFALARDLYQFGRGIDLAWARATITDEDTSRARVASYAGEVHHPSVGATGDATALDCPTTGTLESLAVRHAATLRRFMLEPDGRRHVVVFQQAPKPIFQRIPYNSRSTYAVFELRDRDASSAPLSPRPLTTACVLTEKLRDAAAARLVAALPDRGADIERALVGRTPEGVPRLSPTRRVRMVPLASIGHQHADRGIRRVLVEVPGACPLRADDVLWTFSGLTVPGTSAVLSRTDDEAMLAHYGHDQTASTFRSVTPVVLPDAVARRRIDPTRQDVDTKGSEERAREEARAVSALRQALRHAGVRARLSAATVQREPFDANGQRAELFARQTRFAKERLWHVELQFERPVRGPLLLGDGRFLGLGLLAPVRTSPAVIALRIESGWQADAEPLVVARALRRAVMSRFQAQIGTGRLPSYVSGHEPDGSPVKDKPHLYFVCDPDAPMLLIIPPHLGERRASPRYDERQPWTILERALADLTELRAGRAGLLRLVPMNLSEPFQISRTWVSRTPYVVNRHHKTGDPGTAVQRDIQDACRRAGLPTPDVNVTRTHARPGVGLSADATLSFPTPVTGPILIGRTRYLGGGWFAPSRA